MKISVDIDCTPEEARTFLGLPDVKPMQEALMVEIQKQMTANLKAIDAENLMKVWLPASLKGWEQLMTLFHSQMSRIASRKDESPKKKE